MKRRSTTSISSSIPRSVERDYVAALGRAGVSQRDLDLLRELARGRGASEAATAKRVGRSRHYG
jgi:hypothetical protein